MKQMRKLFIILLISVPLCSGCSVSGSGPSEPMAVAALPLAGQDACASAGFADVPSGVWYAEAAAWCREHNILTGTTFDAETAMTRAAVADALYRAEGSPSVKNSPGFADVPSGSAYANAVSWVSEKGVMSGYDDGRFGGEDPVTREEMAAILWRCAGSPAAPSGEDFADEENISASAGTAVDWARANGILGGKGDNLFDPKGSLTRAQTAVILHRCLAGGRDTGTPGPVVYMTTDISTGGLLAVYAALGWIPGERVAVKLSTGEPGSNYLRPGLIGPLVQSLDNPTIVECNTAYGGSRAGTAMHYS